MVSLEFEARRGTVSLVEGNESSSTCKIGLVSLSSMAIALSAQLCEEFGVSLSELATRGD